MHLTSLTLSRDSHDASQSLSGVDGTRGLASGWWEPNPKRFDTKEGTEEDDFLKTHLAVHLLALAGNSNECPSNVTSKVPLRLALTLVAFVVMLITR